MEQVEARDLLVKMVQSCNFTSKEMHIFKLCMIFGYTQREIAKLINRSAQNVQQTKQRVCTKMLIQVERKNMLGEK